MTNSYLPSKPDSELHYPLARKGCLVISSYSNRSYNFDLTLQGLTDEECANLAHIIINAEVTDPAAIVSWLQHISGSIQEREKATAIAAAQDCKPLTDDSDSGSGSDSDKQPVTIRQTRTRKRITQDELDASITILTSLVSLIDGKSRKEIIALSGIDVRLWPKASSHMVDTGLWVGRGERKDKRYFWNM